MRDPAGFIELLNSYFNLVQAVLVHADKLTPRELELIVGATSKTIQYRRKNPLLWRVSEIKFLVLYYQLSPRVCMKMYRVIPDLINYLQLLPVEERKQVERLCQVKMTLLINWLNYDLSIADLKKIHKGLLQLA